MLAAVASASTDGDDVGGTHSETMPQMTNKPRRGSHDTFGKELFTVFFHVKHTPVYKTTPVLGNSNLIKWEGLPRVAELLLGGRTNKNHSHD